MNIVKAIETKKGKLEAHLEVKLTVSIEDTTMVELLQQADKINNALPGAEIKLLVDVNGKMKPLYIHDSSATVERVYNKNDECIYNG
ncbi:MULTISPECIES: hypothetical protein [Bacillaceae]|uniref:Uncharacterized protein n=1 Tax=Evansella alkalicola TaxID=745819 RepID=A0ABS6JZT7_9BACI|nr:MULTISPECIES: hypothetical protein [Bacillaceae]MBU9724104.1 hypothetical protein [Bacillus alkalicola]